MYNIEMTMKPKYLVGFFGRSKFKNKYNYVLISILLISLLIRFHGISDESLWYDEALYIYHSQQSVGDVVKWHATTARAPLNSIFLNLWIKLFGISELATRSLSAIFGTLSILMIFLVGKELYNKRVGLYSAIILAFSSFNVYYSQEARNYSLLVLLTLFSFYFYIKYIYHKNIFYAATYIIASSLMMYTHGFAFLVILVQNLHFVFRKIYRKNIKGIKSWLVIQFIIFLLFLLWIVITIGPIKNYSSKLSWIVKPTIFGMHQFSIEYTFIRFAGNSVLLTVFLALIGIYLFKYVYTKITEKTHSDIQFESLILLYLWFLLPIFIPFFYSLYFSPVYVIRYVIFSSPAFYILVALAVLKLIKIKYQFISISLILIYSAFLVITFDSGLIIKEEWEPATEFIKDNFKDGDIIISGDLRSFGYYYDRDCFTSQNIGECMMKNQVFFIRDLDKLNENKQLLNSSVWLLLRAGFVSNPCIDNNAYPLFSKTKELSLTKNYRGINICYFKNV